ncbi:bifunctional biotin--[acetyl-CoA-carboxylase] synthetase/biotin operon repressor [compost metagenome]
MTSLRNEGASVSPDELFAHLFLTMAETLSVWDRGRGVAHIIDQWRAAARGIGETITVNLPDRSLSGRFAGIDQDGRLMLDTGSDTMQTIAAGDVFFG